MGFAIEELVPEGSTQALRIGLTAARLNVVDFHAGPEGGLLEGNPLDGRMLGIIRPAAARKEAAGQAVVLTLRAAPRDFDIAPLDATGKRQATTPIRDGLVALIYAKSLVARPRASRAGQVRAERTTPRVRLPRRHAWAVQLGE